MADICSGVTKGNDSSVASFFRSHQRSLGACDLQVAELRTHIGSGFLHLGVKPGSTVGLYSANHTGMESYIDSSLLFCSCLLMPAN